MNLKFVLLICLASGLLFFLVMWAKQGKGTGQVAAYIGAATVLGFFAFIVNLILLPFIASYWFVFTSSIFIVYSLHDIELIDRIING